VRFPLSRQSADHRQQGADVPIRVACIGAGPGGLFLGVMVKKLIPDAEVTLFERNRAEDAFGFGVVFSDQTLSRIDTADAVLHDALAEHGRHWDSIEVRLKGQTLGFSGNGMAAIHRRTLLSLLQRRATELGVDQRYSAPVSDIDSLSADFDVVVAADGANSATRERYAGLLQSHADVAEAKFIWFGTTYMFDGLTFLHRKGVHGNFAVHGYPISAEISTFIVETDAATWCATGLDEFDTSLPPGRSDLKTKAFLEQLFGPDIDGHPLVTNNSRWGNFRTRRTLTWHAENVVFLGDAVHTAHFSVGSGTKMAMEDAISLATQLANHPTDIPQALSAYEAERQPQVAKIQNSAGPSLSWWENFGRYYDAFEPWQFAFHFFSRSIPVSKLRQRDPSFVQAAETGWHRAHGAGPLDAPLAVGCQRLAGRVGTLSADGKSFTDTAGTMVALDQQTGTGNGVLVTAPEAEAAVDDTVRQLPSDIAAAGLVLVTDGTPLTRALLSERIRFDYGATTAVVLDRVDPDLAYTLVLSGRADAVAYPQKRRQ
jgi:2-polyprenyl-6-methoxyphenol hydroxylase-like FAD-dependent oxidoreductase